MYDFFIEPLQYIFMRKALAGCICLSLGAGPVGIFLVLRRMSLMGDALSHAILPGAAIGYALMGLSVPAMVLGGIGAGLVVALLAGVVTRFTHLKEDASFAGFFLISLALGTLIISSQRSSIDLIHILFGSALSVDFLSLIIISGISTLTLATFAIIYRPMIMDCFDPLYLRTCHKNGVIYHMIFLTLVVLNLVSGFQALGTLLSLGMMMLPAISARFWSRRIWILCLVAALIGCVSGYMGLLLANHYNIPSGPSIVLVAGAIYIISLLVGPYGSIQKTFSFFKQ